MSLDLQQVIGFSGKVQNGLHYHPDGVSLIYPLGNSICIRNLQTKQTQFLHGHNGPVSCISVSKTGRFIASGNSTHMGFKADVIIWDFETRQLLHRMTIHKVCVSALAFSPDERMLTSIGGQDDLTVFVWSVEEGKKICSTTAPAAGNCISFFNNQNDTIVAGGKYMLRVWEIDYVQRKMTAVDCQLGQLKRVFVSIIIDELDEYAYCGTTTGDLLCVQMKGPKNFKFAGPKNKIDKGIVSVGFAPDGNLLVGGGDGSLSVLNRENLLKMRAVKLMGGVTSISCTGNMIYAGTQQSVIYLADYQKKDLDPVIVFTCHYQRVNDVAYPRGTSEIIATCSVNDIRLWNATKGKELVRIQVPNLECNCVCFNTTGSAILSGWSDGKIRAFGPQSGKLLFVINDAHKDIETKKISGSLLGVTALAVSHDNKRIVSGGSDGQVRVWNVSSGSQTLVASMKEHKATVNHIAIRSDDSQCITASDDGSCIVWSLDKFTRSNIMYAQTYFKRIVYLDDESQILTTGSDRRVTYWDALECTAIRELEGSESGELLALDIAPDGQTFLTGGQDKQVKIWHYDQGEVLALGEGHSTNITKAKFSPDNRFICSVGDDGSIFFWRVPGSSAR